MNIEKLTVPILQAPIGRVATTELAAAVSNAGGMGSLAMTWTQPGVASALVDRLNAETDAPYFVNFVLTFPPVSFDAVIEAGVPAITLSWGHAPELIARAHSQGIPVGVQIGTVEGARKAVRDGADFLICQGIEAGGHVQTSTSLSKLLPYVVETARDTPVVAAGGLADGNDLSWALGKGAAAIMLGTRFVATVESGAHPLYKEAVVKANSSDTAYTLCFDGGWPYAAHRVIRNATLEMWEDAGCPPHGSRPGEGEVVGSERSGAKIMRYGDACPLESTEGDVLDCALYAGTSVERISDVPTARDLVSQIWNQYRDFTDML